VRKIAMSASSRASTAPTSPISSATPAPAAARPAFRRTNLGFRLAQEPRSWISSVAKTFNIKALNIART
jgi:hypothetical protein